MLETYALERQRGVAPPTWAIDTFLALDVPFESLLPVLETLFYNEQPPFTGRNLRAIADDILLVVERWLEDGMRGTGASASVLGGAANAAGVSALLQTVGESPAGESKRGRFRELRERVERVLR